MFSVYLKLEWKCFRKDEGEWFYLVCCGKLIPDMSQKLSAKILSSLLIDFTLVRLDKLEEYNGEIYEEFEPNIPISLTNNPQVIFGCKFKDEQDLMRYRAELF